MALQRQGLLTGIEHLFDAVSSDKEGHLLGGFIGMSNDTVVYIPTNDGCKNKDCSNYACYNSGCSNQQCSNTRCVELPRLTEAPSSTTSTSAPHLRPVSFSLF